MDTKRSYYSSFFFLATGFICVHSSRQQSCPSAPPFICLMDEKNNDQDHGEYDLYIIPITVSTFSVAEMEVDIDFYILLEETNAPKGDLNIERNVTPPEMEFRNCHQCSCVVYNITRVISGSEKANWKKRHIGRFYCDFDLGNFPMDTQECYIEVVSRTNKINLKRDPRLKNDFKTLVYWHLPEFEIVGSRPKERECDKLPFNEDTVQAHCVQYMLQFRRKLPYHIFNIYCPSFIVVVVSWISFWLDPEMTSPRVALGLTPLLTLSTQLSNIQRSLPPVSYIKASDVWMSTCVLLVFAALTELPFALYYHRCDKRTTIQPLTGSISELNRMSEVVNTFVIKSGFALQGWKCVRCKYEMDPSPMYPLMALKLIIKKTYYFNAGKTNIITNTPASRVNKVDYIARRAFPVIFALFNIVYWVYYRQFAVHSHV